MRLFISINIPEHYRNLINNKISVIKNEINQELKWVKEENWHLTLKFLGEVEDKTKISRVKDILSELKDDYNSFPIRFQNISAFPDINHPKVIYVGINQDQNKLIKIHNSLDTSLSKVGFESENKKYTPHLTFARSKSQTNLKQISNSLKKYINKYFINIYMKCDEISLMESKLLPEGPVYEKVFGISLKNT